MAIRDRFRRALRKSDSSDSISQTESTLTTTSTASTSRSSLSDASSQQSHKSAPRLTRTFTFGHRDKEKDKTKEKEKEKKNKNKTRPHPSERPLTTQNLKHQELLSQFTMTFGTQNISQIEFYDSNGISPCCTRPCSIDEGSRPLFSSVEGLSLED